jgi:hypothetical protein
MQRKKGHQRTNPRWLRALDICNRQQPKWCPLRYGSKPGGALHEHLIVERLTPASGRRSEEQGGALTAASWSGHSAARGGMLRLKDVGVQVGIAMARG